MLEEQREAPSPSYARFHRHDRLFSFVSDPFRFVLFIRSRTAETSTRLRCTKNLLGEDSESSCHAPDHCSTRPPCNRRSNRRSTASIALGCSSCGLPAKCNNVFGQVQPRSAHFDSLLFTLWSSTTREVIEKGAGFVSLATKPPLTPHLHLRNRFSRSNRLPWIGRRVCF